MVSYDDGSDWAQIDSGLPDGTSVDALWTSDAYLFAGTEMGALWRLRFKVDRQRSLWSCDRRRRSLSD